MKKIEESKKVYDGIEIPEELQSVVQKAIKETPKSKIRPMQRKYTVGKVCRYCVATAAGLLVCMTLGLNTSEAFAKEMSELPIIGRLANVLTVRSYHHMDKETGIQVDVDVPKVEVEDEQAEEDAMPAEGLQPDTEFVADINAEIEKIADEHIAEAEQHFEEYKAAFFATGGTEEEWAGRTMDIIVDYDIKYQEGNIVSFVLSVAENAVFYSEDQYYYNLDLKENRELTLEDLLGEEYVAIANESILRQMKERMAADENYVYWGLEENEDIDMGGFETVDENTTFYINEKMNPVVTFPKYEVAPGFMGIQEFEIEREAAK